MRGHDVSRPQPTWLFHFTRIEHLASIAEYGLHCDHRAQENGLLAIEIGNTSIKARRKRRPVPVAPGGVVADYVPFYFAPRSPMMFSISKGNVPGYGGGTNRLAYLATTVERLNELGLDLVFTDRNAVLDYTAFARTSDPGQPADFIDWPLMKERYWGDTDDYPDRCERRMAECLVHDVVPWEAITFVGVRSQTALDEVNLLLGPGVQPTVEVRAQWYF